MARKAQSKKKLPAWNLNDLFPSPESPELTGALAQALVDAKAFESSYQGRIKAMNGTEFAEALVEFERIETVLCRIMSYVQLLHASDVCNSEFGRLYQTIRERVTVVSTHILFFTLEINRLDDDKLAAKTKNQAAGRYWPWIRNVRQFRPHQLPDEMEKLLHEKEVSGRGAWARLFDETIAGLRFPLKGKELSITEILDLMSDRQSENRMMAAKSLGHVLGENIRVFSLITNTLAKDKEIEDNWRSYSHPAASRNLANQVEDEVVEALVHAVKGAFDQLSHRYYALKAKWLGVDKLDYWDRNAPLPEDIDRRYSWDEARDIVLDSYRRFSPELAEIGERFFTNGWIDADPRPGKAPGAFAHPTSVDAHPYLLVNFMGRARDVMTLAHELGHGIHQVLSAGQGQLMSDTPLTLAETASVFGEMLTFRAMLKSESDPKVRRIFLASKVEDMLNTVVRQIAFHDFEHKLHAERRNGEISAERLGDMWMEVQYESLGPAFRFDEEYRNYWAYIPHFVHTPFYVYAYAFGDCLVNSLYAVYAKGAPGFVEHYIEMLKAGGTKRHKDLLTPFNLNAGDPAFWRRGLDMVSGFIDQLEKED
jgi:oligoendopeptidase F